MEWDFAALNTKAQGFELVPPSVPPVVLHLFKKQCGVHCSTQAGITAGCIGTSCLALWAHSGLLALWTFDASSGKSPEGCVA